MEPMMTFSKTFGAKILLVAAGAMLCGVLVFSLAKGNPAGNPEATKIAVSPEIESAAKNLFKVFYAYHDQPRGMVPVTFKDAAGQVRSLEDYRGKVVVLNFWATWCAPCAKELPALQALQTLRGGDRFTVLAASADFGMPAERILEFMKKNNAPDLPLALLEETDGVWEIVSAGLPITFIINAEGRVIYKMLGEADWRQPTLVTLIDNLLANTASTGKN